MVLAGRGCLVKKSLFLPGLDWDFKWRGLPIEQPSLWGIWVQLETSIIWFTLRNGHFLCTSDTRQEMKEEDASTIAESEQTYSV